MSDKASRQAWRGLGAILLGCVVIAALGGCAVAESSSSRSTAQTAGNTSCSLRAVVNLRQGSSIRNDADLVDVARRLGVNLSVVQTMGRNSRMVIFRENGPQAACEDSLATLRNDLRIDSIERY